MSLVLIIALPLAAWLIVAAVGIVARENPSQ